MQRASDLSAAGPFVPGPTTSPLVLDTYDLGRRPGARLRVLRTVPAPADLSIQMIGIPEGDDVDLNIRLESVMEGVLISGTARADAVGECVRCLDAVRVPMDVDFQELFVYPERARAAKAAGDDDEDQLPELDGDLADLEPVLRDAIVTALPFSPLCRDDCPGLCPNCGARLADDPDHRHDVTDPRWSALATMFDTQKSDTQKSDTQKES